MTKTFILIVTDPGATRPVANALKKLDLVTGVHEVMGTVRHRGRTRGAAAHGCAGDPVERDSRHRGHSVDDVARRVPGLTPEARLGSTGDGAGRFRGLEGWQTA